MKTIIYSGYRLHWEGSIEPALSFATMAQVDKEIRAAARVAGISVRKARDLAYVVTESEYQAEQAEERFQKGE